MFYWRGALTKAVAARALSQRVWNHVGDEPFVAGLLQDLGMLVLLQDLKGPYIQFLDSVVRSGQDLRQLEIATFGFDHTVVSAQLLEHWQFPSHVIEAVGMPHDIDRINSLPPERRGLPQLLHMADLLCQVVARQRAAMLPELLRVADIYCQLTASQLESVVADLQQTVMQLADVLSLDLPNDISYTELLWRAQAQLAEAAEEVVCKAVCVQPEDQRLLRASRQLAAAVEKIGAAERTSASQASLPAGAVESAPLLDDAGLVGRVSAALALCRQSRTSLSLAMIAMDDYAQLLTTRGPDHVKSVIRLLETAAHTLCRAPGDCLHLGDGQFAVILENSERAQAAEACRRLIRGMRQWSRPHQHNGLSAMTISVGVATLRLVPKNFPARELIDAASRCVFAAQASGGDVLKSIDIY